LAETVQIRGKPAKIRSPLGVFLLALITFGIYYIVWYYKTNRELRDSAGIDVSPGMSTLAITLGGILIIPPFVSMWRYFKRIRQAQDRGRRRPPDQSRDGLRPLSDRAGPPSGRGAYAQHHLNRLWRHELDEESKRASGMRGQPATDF
jgi:hypothetical protein